MSKPIKIILLIDYIGSGGAQRQLFMLARMLKRNGAEVEVLTCFAADFFLPHFQAEGIPVQHVRSQGKAHRVVAIRKAIRRRKPDVLISFLKTPNILAELAGWPWRSFKTIVSERNTDTTGLNFSKRLRFFLHRFADAVVVNSHSQHQYISSNIPELRNKLYAISNCVDLDDFHPAKTQQAPPSKTLRVLVLGRIHAQKDPFGLGKALIYLSRNYPELELQVDWFGEHVFIFDESKPHREEYLERLQLFIKENGLQDRFRLHRPQANVHELYWNADVFCLPSLYEGCSNVLGEAMACGLPVIATRAGDNQRLVVDGVSGLLVDPGDPRQLADAIVRFHALNQQERRSMGSEGRRLAELILSQQVFHHKYSTLIDQLLCGDPKTGTASSLSEDA